MSLLDTAKVILLYGATASGKSELALAIAEKFPNSLIINGDSKQVYREVPLITAQPKIDINHKIYSIISLKEKFSVARWLQLLQKERELSPNKKLIIVGGTGLYLEAIIKGLSEVPQIPENIYNHIAEKLAKHGWNALYQELLLQDSEAKLLPNDKQRLIRALAVLEGTGKSLTFWQKQPTKPFIPEKELCKIWLKPKREILYDRINRRFIQMLESGALEEAEAVRQDKEITQTKIIGLEDILNYLNGILSRQAMIEKAQQKTRNYAKRQETWFKNKFIADIILTDTQPTKVIF
jgi:tRNA dimethylallyltransferase